MNKLNIKQAVLFWFLSLIIVAICGLIVDDIAAISFNWAVEYIYKSAVPLIACSLIVIFMRYVVVDTRYMISYFLFFAISLTSLFGSTSALTGSHAESSNFLLYGLSFYTVSIAYLKYSGQLENISLVNVSNPLLIITGPIAIYIFDIKHKRIASRLKYYIPYVILGVFLHQSVAMPLTPTFILINKTDMASSIAFSVIFELFVYANFCGLSLMVYGVAGIVGYRVPLNFRQPFSANNLIEFWKGWHTSLSMVLKTLFYTPVRKKYGSSLAIITVYLVSAMWHGITLNFLFWGIFHSLMFILTLYFLRKKHRILPVLLLPVAIVIGRMLFADVDTQRVLTKLRFDYVDLSILDMLSNVSDITQLSLILAVAFVTAEFVFQKQRYFRQRTYKFFRIPIIQLVLLSIVLITISNRSGVDYAVYGQR